MFASIELVAIFVIGVGAFFLYRALINSKWFTELLISVTNPRGQTTDEVLASLQKAEVDAWHKSKEAEHVIIDAKQTIADVRRHVRRKPTPF